MTEYRVLNSGGPIMEVLTEGLEYTCCAWTDQDGVVYIAEFDNRVTVKPEGSE
jgi:hypothetical protein